MSTVMVLVMGVVIGAGPQVPGVTSAPGAQSLEPRMVIEHTSEEGEEMLLATVSRGGQPLEGATVAFSVKRTFGNLFLGESETLGDGSAGVAFPTTLPGGPAGELHVIAELRGPGDSAGMQAETVIPGLLRLPEAPPVTRALWTSRAPLGLILSMVFLLAGVWATYCCVIAQIIQIRKGATAHDPAALSDRVWDRRRHPADLQQPSVVGGGYPSE